VSSVSAPRIGLRRDFGYWSGGSLLGFAAIGATAWVVLAFGQIAHTVDGFQRVSIPSSADVRLEARKYVIYVEGPRADQAVPPVKIAITKRGGSTRPPVLRPYGGSLTYAAGRAGSAQATVTPPRAGVYRVRATSSVATGSFQLAVGSSIAGKIVFAVVGALVIAAVFGIAGIVLLILTRRRRRAMRPQAADAGSRSDRACGAARVL
jgi:hypothetical protein